MSVCPSRTLLSALLLAVFPALFGPAAAQVGPPVQLVPREQPQDSPAAPAAPNPEPAAPAPAPDAAASGLKTGPGGIQYGQLGALDPSGVGTLDEGNGGLPNTLWQGSQLSLIAALLPKLAPSTSPALQSLARRLLASGAAVPEGAADGPSLLSLRVAALDRLGLVHDASALAQAAPGQVSDPAFLQASRDAFWLAGNTKAACGRLNAVPGPARDQGWDKANAFCRALAGEHEAASISVGLLREENVTDVPFFALFAVVNGEGEIKLASLPNPPPLTLAMLRASNKPVPSDVLQGAPPATFAAVAGMSNATAPLRIAAAERAAAFGGETPADLAKLYAAQNFPPEALAKAPTAAKANREGLGNALMYQAVVAEKVPAAEAEAIAAAFSLAGGAKVPAPLWLQRVYGPILFRITPGPGVIWFADTATRAYLAGNDVNNARAWASLGDTDRVLAAPGQPPAGTLLGRLMALADKEATPPDGPTLAAWYKAAEAVDGAERDARTALFYALLEALGQPVPADAWQAIAGGAAATSGTLPSPIVLHGLSAAANAGRLGETALYALLAFGDGGPATADATTLSAVIAALRKVGLEADARAIAVEAALGHGL
jgi:hypothetical protein